MFYGKALFRKRGIFLMFILTTVVLFLVADHLFKGNKRRERISTFYSDPGQIISHPSTDTHSKEGYSAKDFEDMSNMKWPHQFRHTSDGDVTGVKGLRDQYGNSRNANTLLACGDALCTKYLSRSDMSALFQCQRNATKKMKRLAQSGNDTQSPLLVSLHRDYSTGALSSGKCRFMEGTGRGPVGLVSFPGSGNTWVRGLLQKVTRICTGAVYCDSMLRLGGFDGEGLQSSSVLVVKSHAVAPSWSKKLNHLQFKGIKYRRIKFDAVIFLVRNPFHALVSEWNRQLSARYNHGNRTGLAHVDIHGRENFLESHNWTRFVGSAISRWSKTFDWITECPVGHKILVVRYEDIASDEHGQVRRMLTFLQNNISDAELSQRLKGGGIPVFHRPKRGRFEHFTAEQKRMTDIAILGVERLLQAKAGQTFGVEKYLSLGT